MKKLSERIAALESTEATIDQVRVIRFVGLGEEARLKAVRATIGGPGGPEVLRYDEETEAEFIERVEHEARIRSSPGQFMVAMVWP
ncbi:hypothetical protein [Hydrogenophaga sp.]|uniref:hypothetical protein n=1 Tax=Hydrogenophaga sp. TaxID=1904254 RepID=UPI00272F58B2|nr:hypothetical protein [Hydrogenophaga sp.]MDP1684987.1 hypothetical protein [Hydrogenophaga sp.]